MQPLPLKNPLPLNMLTQAHLVYSPHHENVGITVSNCHKSTHLAFSWRVTSAEEGCVWVGVRSEIIRCSLLLFMRTGSNLASSCLLRTSSPTLACPGNEQRRAAYSVGGEVENR